MKDLREQIRAALGGRYAGDELRTVVNALCLEGLGLNPTSVYLGESVSLSETQRGWLREAVERLQAGEPLQYVLGTAPFAGFELMVDGRVLIPRPETAELVALAQALMEVAIQRTKNDAQRVRILDVGTGSGCIAIALKKALSEAEVTACDISEEALEVARLNAERCDAELRFVQANVLELVNESTGQRVGELPMGCACIVSNPPYVRRCEKAMMEQRVTEWEPALALFAPDDDPLVFYRALTRLGQTQVLAEGGWLVVEINSDFAFETSALFTLRGYQDVCVKEDFFGRKRFVMGRKV